MTDSFQITLMLLASVVATIFSRRIKIPAVIGQMLVGILLGPAVFGWIHNGEVISVMSEIGVILLMFLAGLESDLAILKKNFKASMLVAVLGVIFPLLCFFGSAFVLGKGVSTSLFYGIVFSATSVSITVEVLQEYGVLSTRAGAIILGAAVVDDILAVFLFSIFSSVKNGGDNFLFQIILELLFFVFLFFVHKLIPKIWKTVEKIPVYAKNTTVALLICLGLSLFANAVGMSAAIGSFFAGVAISQTEVRSVIKQNTAAIAYVVFIPIFFISIALSVHFNHFIDQALLIFFFTILSVLTKIIPAYGAGKISHLTHEESLLIGAGMISRGEMALIVAQIGLTSAVITDKTYSELVIVIMLATFLAPFVIKWAIKKTNEKTYPKR